MFKAGAAFSGVPYTCFATGSASNRWNSECSGGRISKTAQAWGDLVRANNPGYGGPWPRMQLWHGTSDTTLSYNNFAEEIKQWTNVNGLSQTPTRTDSPSSGDTRTQYADASGSVRVEGHSLAGVTHNLPVNAASAISFFGLDGTTPTPTPTTPTPTPTTSTSPTPSPTPSTPLPGVACTAVYTTSSAWAEGFIGSVKVTAGAAISNWNVALTIPAGTAITNVWNGTRTGNSVANATWNGKLAAGQSVEFGFQGTGSATGVSAAGCTGS